MKRSDQSPAIGEMMLAKSILEQKNETIDQKDRSIRELSCQLREMRQELEQSGRESAQSRQDARWQGVREVLEEVLRLVCDYRSGEVGAENKLADRLIVMCREKYGLEVIDETPDALDPEIHQVVEVEQAAGPATSIQVISKGFKVAGRLLRPMQVRVIRGAKRGAFLGADVPASRFATDSPRGG